MAVLDKAGSPAIKYGLSINNVISCVILGFVIFMFIKAYNKMKEPEKAPVPTTKICSECAGSIPTGG